MVDNAVILGAGPSGLMAAHAAQQAGLGVVIYSDKRKSPIGGAQYVHTNIPDLTEAEPDGEVLFEYRGNRQGYAEKVYGNPGAKCSWGEYFGRVPVWNMRKVYNELWNRFEQAIKHRIVLPTDIVSMQSPETIVISTIPRPSLCWKPGRHSFSSQQVWIDYHQEEPRENKIIYNGMEDVPWYRSSHLFSWESVEYPGDYLPGAQATAGLISVYKPLDSNCDCLPGVAKMGRYGRWQKGILTHHVYWDTVAMLARLEQGGTHGAL